MRIPETIISYLRERRCLFFIGSGMSTEAGLPSTAELVDILKKKLEQSGTKTSGSELKKVAQDFCIEFGRLELLRVIRDEIVKRLENADRTSFKLLAELSPLPRDIVTTNWDPLIEESLGKLNYNPIFEPKSVAKCDEGAKTNLFKIHGDIEHDIVITEEDYIEFRNKWEPLVIKIMSLFQERAIVFIGYSTDDEDFLNMYLDIFKKLGKDYLLPRYCVDPNIGDLKDMQLRERGIIPIRMTARDFLKELNHELQKRLVEFKLPSPKTVPEPLKDYNPFGIFRIEDVENVKWINETFVEPIDFATIVMPGNVIIEGHRGSGKSMILQYLSYLSTCERNEDANYIGFYVKLQNSYVDTVRRRGMETEEWKEFFLHYFNLLLGESILISLVELLNKKKISFAAEKEFAERVMFIFFPEMPVEKRIESLRDLLDIFKRERNKCARYPRPKEHRLSPHFIYDFIKLIEEYVEEFKNKYFYILIDEYDKLDEDQQKVVNLYIADRGAALRYRVSFKIAVKLFEMCYETIDGKMLDPIDDYQWVPLDRFPEEMKNEFIKRLREIGNKRLNFYKYQNESIDEILPEGGQGFESGDYSGIDNVLNLSSFLIRDFLELVKDMLYYAFPWITLEKHDKIPPVPPNIQNFVISVHSNILYTTKIDEIPGKIGDKERKYLARLLIEKMGVIFQRVLQGSKQTKERRTVSSFQIRDEINLNEIAKSALDDCRVVGALQVPYIARAPQNYARHAPHRKYEFHRLLCPRFRLALAKRWPKELDASQINKIFEKPDEAVDEITAYFLKNIFIDDTIEFLGLTAEVQRFKNTYREVCAKEYSLKELFGRIGDLKIGQTIDEGQPFSLQMGKEQIFCSSKDEAEYLKIFADMGLKSVKVPKNLESFKEKIEEIKTIKNKVNKLIEERIEEYPALKKKINDILPIIWGKLLEI
jgi:hypothetical protein